MPPTYGRGHYVLASGEWDIPNTTQSSTDTNREAEQTHENVLTGIRLQMVTFHAIWHGNSFLQRCLNQTNAWFIVLLYHF